MSETYDHAQIKLLTNNLRIPFRRTTSNSGVVLVSYT
jgi:hypothetical protein